MLGIKVLTRGPFRCPRPPGGLHRKGRRVICGPHADPPPNPSSPLRFRGQRGGVAAAVPAGWPWKAPGHEPARLEHDNVALKRWVATDHHDPPSYWPSGTDNSSQALVATSGDCFVS